ncbi:MAG: preprotein translocase subunit SecF [bacterium ADurb.Bin429]|nr:MAG: preprotein translocase subunit SecF [bacterium ADurb.Bin429]
MVDLFRNRHWDLVSKRGWYYLISAIILLVGFTALFLNKARTGAALNYGIDFEGGGLVSYRIAGELPSSKHAAVIQELRSTLEEKGLTTEVQVSSGGLNATGDVVIVRILMKNMADEEKNDYLNAQVGENITPAVESALAAQNAKLDSVVQQPESQEVVTGTVSQELVNNGILAVVLGLLLILGWIYIRYNIGGFSWRFATAGIVALSHDILSLIGIFALLHTVLQVNSPFIAALLTVLGFSIHDTIIIFDRIRENMRLRKGRTFAETVNISILETLARSVNTVLTTLFPLIALYFFGGPTLRDFVAAMLIGIVLGAYSSIFVAGQLVVSWSKKQDKVMPGSLFAAPEPAMAAATAAPAASVPVTTAAPSVPAPQAGPDKDAIKRARQAGKTAKRKR